MEICGLLHASALETVANPEGGSGGGDYDGIDPGLHLIRSAC